jgi:hypothetical protein
MLRRTVEYGCALDPSLSLAALPLPARRRGKLFDQKSARLALLTGNQERRRPSYHAAGTIRPGRHPIHPHGAV